MPSDKAASLALALLMITAACSNQTTISERITIGEQFEDVAIDYELTRGRRFQHVCLYEAPPVDPRLIEGTAQIEGQAKTSIRFQSILRQEDATWWCYGSRELNGPGPPVTSLSLRSGAGAVETARIIWISVNEL